MVLLICMGMKIYCLAKIELRGKKFTFTLRRATIDANFRLISNLKIENKKCVIQNGQKKRVHNKS